MDLASLAQLVEPQGWELLQSLPAYDPASELALQTRLRSAGFAPDLVAAALAQSRLRSRARDKFGPFAQGMLFTPDGLEQATRLEVAARHAERFLRAEVRRVHDLGCGIGADAMAFAGLDLGVDAVDADELTAAVAGVNLRHWRHARVRHARAEDVALPTGTERAHAGVWMDPARRMPGTTDRGGRTRRTHGLEHLSPSWAQLLSWAAAVPATGAKLAPGLPHDAVPPGVEAQWVSWQGEVVECGLWWGPLARTPGRTALVLRRGRDAVRLAESDAAGGPRPLAEGEPVRRYLYEADRAVIQAGLTGALALHVEGRELDDGVGYVTADARLDVPWAHRYAVEDSMPWQAKTVRSWLRERSVGRLTIKKRGVRLDPEAVRRQLRLSGSQEATLVLTRVAGQAYAVLVQPS